MASAADRYRTLLDASCAVAEQPTVKAVLHSLRAVLRSSCTSWTTTEKVCTSEEQKPAFIPDLSQEMPKHPALTPVAPEVVGRSAYMFPVSTSQKRYGAVSVTKVQGRNLHQKR